MHVRDHIRVGRVSCSMGHGMAWHGMAWRAARQATEPKGTRGDELTFDLLAPVIRMRRWADDRRETQTQTQCAGEARRDDNLGETALIAAVIAYGAVCALQLSAASIWLEHCLRACTVYERGR